MSRWMIAVAIAAAAGCSYRKALDRSVGLGGRRAFDVPITRVPVRGFPVQIELKRNRRQLKGELLAVARSVLWLYRAQHKVRLVKIRHDEIAQVLVAPRSRAGLAGWTAAGALSAGSHGVFGVISLPLWLLTGIPATLGTRPYLAKAALPKELRLLYQFARFPQGLPAGWLDRHRAAAKARRGQPSTAGAPRARGTTR